MGLGRFVTSPPVAKEIRVFYVHCASSGAKVEIPSDAVGPEWTDLCKLVECLECLTTFDYSDEHVQLGRADCGVE